MVFHQLKIRFFLYFVSHQHRKPRLPRPRTRLKNKPTRPLRRQPDPKEDQLDPKINQPEKKQPNAKKDHPDPKINQTDPKKNDHGTIRKL